MNVHDVYMMLTSIEFSSLDKCPSTEEKRMSLYYPSDF